VSKQLGISRVVLSSIELVILYAFSTFSGLYDEAFFNYSMSYLGRVR
jgi:hypothetical protein